MPLLEYSSYHPPFLLNNAHIQTILPSYMRREEDITYEREVFKAPDKDDIYLDWSRVGANKLMIVNHGLCGHTHRHYILSMVKAFNKAGWDCLAWNYRWTGETVTNSPRFTTNDSTDQLGWVTHHAIDTGHYQKVAFSGYSMGGNLGLLYLAREAKFLPPEVIGGAFFCATIDLTASTHKFSTAIGKLYAKHFVGYLLRMIERVHERFPDSIDVSHINDVKTFDEFDEHFTVPIMGYQSAYEYWEHASAYKWIDNLQVPVLVVNPCNDPFLAGKCYPIEEARRSPYFYLEIPEGGGHCGFITPGLDTEWWPALRARQFLAPLAVDKSTKGV